MSEPFARPPRTWTERLVSRAEVWIYEANERGSAPFRLYDFANEVWATLFFGRIRHAALALNVLLEGKGGETCRMRLLRPEDVDAFAELLGGFDFRYLPPHGRDRASAEAALRRRSYLPFGVFHEDDLVGYLLLRLFAPKRAVLGIWSRSERHNRGFTQVAGKAAAEFTRAHGYPNYITVPLDNIYSLRAGLWAGYRVVRSNRRFHVLVYRPDLPLPEPGQPG